MITDISPDDHRYWRDYCRKDVEAHENEFMRECDPDYLRCLYRGYKAKNYREYLSESVRNQENTLSVTRMFSAANTILPNIYYQNPKLIAVARNQQSSWAAGLMTSAQNHYLRVLRQKEENQNLAMNGYFFGLGWKKLGYKTFVTPRIQEPEAAGVQEQMRMDSPDYLESGEMQDIIMDEGPFNTSESPCSVLVDHRGTLRNFKVITHRVKRTLHDLMQFSRYDEGVLKAIEAKYRYQHGTRFSPRDIELWVNEQMIKNPNGYWIHSFCDEYEYHMRYDRIQAKKFPWVPLVFTNEPDVRYPVSHMKAGSHVQLWVDRIATLQLEIIGKMRNQVGIWEDALAHGQEQAFKRNMIGGIIKFKKPLTAGAIGNIATAPITPDMFQMLNYVLQNTTEILGADEQRISGKSKNETLGQDQLAAMGTQIRESGMLDKMRDCMIQQADVMAEIITKYDSGKLALYISPKYFQRSIAPQVNPGMVEFGTEQQPRGLNSFMQGSEFEHEVNIYEAVKPDKRALAKEYFEAMTLFSSPAVEKALLTRQKMARIDLLAEKIGENFEYIDAAEFIESLDPMQAAAIMTREMLSQGRVGQPQAQGASPSSASSGASPETPSDGIAKQQEKVNKMAGV